MITVLRLLLLLPTAAWALDLTPQADFKEQEGFKIPQLRFKAEKGYATWMPPNDWRMSFENGRLLFTPKERTHASFELRVLPRKAGDLEVFAKTDSLQSYVGEFLPKTAKGVTFTGSIPGPFMIGPVAATEFRFDFQEPSHPSKAAFCVLDLNDHERLVVVITAQPKDFEEVRGAAIRSMFSWQMDL